MIGGDQTMCISLPYWCMKGPDLYDSIVINVLFIRTLYTYNTVMRNQIVLVTVKIRLWFRKQKLCCVYVAHVDGHCKMDLLTRG